MLLFQNVTTSKPKTTHTVRGKLCLRCSHSSERRDFSPHRSQTLIIHYMQVSAPGWGSSTTIHLRVVSVMANFQRNMYFLRKRTRAQATACVQSTVLLSTLITQQRNIQRSSWNNSFHLWYTSLQRVTEVKNIAESGMEHFSNPDVSSAEQSL